jgi:6-pyruvoyltetrahydropterin/6-carboxytetrahydropterin synthase
MDKMVLDRNLAYLDQAGNLINSRIGLTLSRLFSFLGHNYKYDAAVDAGDGCKYNIDFKINDKYIKLIQSEDELEEFKLIKSKLPSLQLLGLGTLKFGAKIEELNTLNVLDSEKNQIGSIFIEDSSLAFDYAHVLPLVEKCSILHGHTSTVMVEFIGKMIDNLVIDFGEAKRLIKETLSVIDHKFLVNKKYIIKEDNLHYHVSFDGANGIFNLQLPKSTVYVMPGEATVENLSFVILRILSKKVPANVEAIGIYVYEGVNKGAHILSSVKKKP